MLCAKLGKMANLEGKAAFEGVECSSPFKRCIRQGSVEAAQNGDADIVERGRRFEEESSRSFPSNVQLLWADNCWTLSQSKENLEQMVKELVNEVGGWDTEPKPTDKWWREPSGRYGDWSIRAVLRGKFRDILFCVQSRWERMQNANRRDEHIFRSEDVQWRGKCRRVGSQVYSVLCFGSENWCWSHEVVKTKLLRRLFKVKKMEGCDSARVSHENSQNGSDLFREG